MFALFLVAGGTLLEEVSSSIGKNAVKKHRESFYSLGFLSVFWFLMALIIAVVGF